MVHAKTFLKTRTVLRAKILEKNDLMYVSTDWKKAIFFSNV